MNKSTLKQIAALIAACVVGGAAYLNKGGAADDSQNAQGLNITGSSEPTDQWANLVAETTEAASVSGSTMTYGGHTYTQEGDLSIERYNQSATGKVTFTNVPSGYTEFEAVYRQFLGKTPHGTAAMMPMAMEIYGRDKATGEKCIRLICTETTANEALRELKQKYVPSKYSEANDPYVQRYLAAGVLEGATNTNAYTPNEPYTVNMKAGVNQHQEMQMYDGTVMWLYIMGGGWDTTQRTVQIVKTSTSDLFQIFSCPALYTQCKNIKGTWPGLK